MAEQLTEAQSVKPRTSRRDSSGRIGRARSKLVSAATDMVNVADVEPSGWYVHTGEGVAVTEGSDELKRVDVHATLGEKFSLALDAVVEVNSRDDLPESERFEALQDSYSAKLKGRMDPDGRTAVNAARGSASQGG
ncbi:hypothetical protein [Amycolatopsis japonica]|uniref:hypothetical protein n=1 Tax=Amycolatopsis TaxID=1813 RepID=UPI0033D7A74A